MMTNSVFRIRAMASAWANANSLALEKSEGWKIDCTKGTVWVGWVTMQILSRIFSPGATIRHQLISFF
jgi:hypothetical protein